MNRDSIIYLLDTSAIITPFHGGQLRALGLALGHQSILETRVWLQSWFRKGFSSGILVLAQEVYEEVVKNRKKDREEKLLLKSLKENRKIKFLQPTNDTFQVLESIHEFVSAHYQPHQAEDFLQQVDPWLIALAKTYRATLVAEERHFIPQADLNKNQIQGNPHLPFIAWVFKVKCIGLLPALLEVSQKITSSK